MLFFLKLLPWYAGFGSSPYFCLHLGHYVIGDERTQRTTSLATGFDVTRTVVNMLSHCVPFGNHLQVMHLDAEKEMMAQCVALLGRFIAVREPNIRYLGLVSYHSQVVDNIPEWLGWHHLDGC